MPTPLSPRQATAVFAVTACVVVAIVLTLVWPGYLATATSGCGTSTLPTTPIDGRNYCFEPVRLTALPLQCPLATNQSWSGPSLALLFLGFGFNLARYTCGNVSGIAIRINEPNGNVTFGATDYGGPPGIDQVFGWFTSDGRAGLMAYPVHQNQNATIYVETSA